MYGKYRESRAGFTLVEVLVVLAIVALVSAIAIPGLAKLGAFSRDEFKRATQETYSILRAAQLYATTYNVNTAVVYSMDNYSPVEAATGIPEAPAAPVRDSLTDMTVRQFEAVAIMYQMPQNLPNLRNNAENPLKGAYVPIRGELGEFKPLPFGMSIALFDPERTSSYYQYYRDSSVSNYDPGSTNNRVWQLGMSNVTIASGVPEALAPLDLDDYLQVPSNIVRSPFPAHVFRPAGRLIAPADIERISLYVVPSADRPLEDRLVQPDTLSLEYQDANGVDRPNMRFQEIHIFKSTGRIAVPQDF